MGWPDQSALETPRAQLLSTAGLWEFQGPLVVAEAARIERGFIDCIIISTAETDHI